ncbi:ABC transporter related [Gluconacetobacter diazotrophicus PA1 5]|uniref:ATP-binding cassette domain-containing protein n=2 Tax=Gluconacetobacter diazotrophicus TaxID=33996 RepID=A0A7W4FCH9_GLUDI|nr:ATP-binding cassette domain-containing protein [Gluconacetobacter diazotrophicus]ACI51717.1 ABC transporter related [Gluconacetobacter diazotrophicus PA1 5]MBB2155243.1 ATP-binding cassette domain-containing protein [Gluconacetobacter diazotrophicus]TWB11061.1 zinc/manganese transport system ATP-binding protein [Gluconacetobacter diazotrophicus]CAP55189.1 putative ABC transporter protein [Gluconacetobacter diazotrophicus PA1 5]
MSGIASPGDAPPVRFDRATLRIGERTILSDASLTVPAGAFVGVLGPNGAGKSSLMRAILGIVPVPDGRISVFGRPVGRGNHDIGYMPQFQARPAPRLDGRSFIAAALHGERWGLPCDWRPGRHRRRDAAEIDRVLDLVGATHLARRPIDHLSGGERQRLLLAQALLGRPRLLLLDEPLASLDPHRARDVVALVDRIRRRLGIAVLFSTHDLNPLLGVMDMVLYVGRGAARLGPVDEVVTGPVLSALYGTPVEVIRAGGRIFVVADGADAQASDFSIFEPGR